MGKDLHEHHHDENCDCEQEPIILVDEEGNEHEFDFLDMLEVDGAKYAVLAPCEEEEDDEAIILKIETNEDGEDMLYDIEDDAEWEKVVDIWNASLEEE